MTQRRRRRGPRGDITATDLLEAADRVLCSGGLSALTLRAVANEAGVAPNALYTYFGDMADLRNGLGDAFLGRCDPALLRTGTPGEGLRGFLRHTLDLFEGSPGHVELLASQRIAGPHSLALNEALLDFFTDAAGQPWERAVNSTVLLTEWVHGRLLLTPSNPASEGFEAASAGLDPARHPRTARMLTSSVEDTALDLLVRALVPSEA